jgi:hypothetical protein
MLNIEKLLEAVSTGVGDRCGCNDGDEDRTKEWIELAKSKKPADHERLFSSITEAVAYGG